MSFCSTIISIRGECYSEPSFWLIDNKSADLDKTKTQLQSDQIVNEIHTGYIPIRSIFGLITFDIISVSIKKFPVMQCATSYFKNTFP